MAVAAGAFEGAAIAPDLSSAAVLAVLCLRIGLLVRQLGSVMASALLDSR